MGTGSFRCHVPRSLTILRNSPQRSPCALDSINSGWPGYADRLADPPHRSNTAKARFAGVQQRPDGV